MPVETCVYCRQGAHYTMRRWWKGGEVAAITVCYRIRCEKQAEAAGFKRLPHVTAKR